MKLLLVNYARYNLYCNEKFIELFKQYDNALIEKEIVSSFPSIRKTLIHLWDVEVLWLERLKGNSPTEFPSQKFKGSNAEVYQNLSDISKRFLQFVENQPYPYFGKKVQFNLMTATGTFTHTPSEMIHHCMNHQTYHRGQLVTMARQLGITQVPRTDFIIFKREMAGK
jgi:uncharacterized damage-inducible protein DinB